MSECMSERVKLSHRPLTAEELETKAPEFNRKGENRSLQLSIEVESSTMPEPRTLVQRDGDRWRIEVEIPAATAPNRTGLSVGTLPRFPRVQRTAEQIHGFVPRDASVRTRPLTDVGCENIRLRGRRGSYTPLVVFPGDGRRLLTDTSWPWRLTGLVTTSDGFSGAGVLVGDRLMLTAHHLRPNNSIKKGNWWMTFTPSFDNGRKPSAPFGSSNVSDLRHYDDESDTEFIVGHDYMLCRLYQPLGQQLGYLGATSFDDNWRGLQVWDNIGYPGDVGGGTRPAVQFNQSFEDDYEDDNGQELETEASLNKGNSGGPFFAWFTDGHVRLCGVVSGGLSFGDDRDNAIAGGDDMVHLINWGRSNWPA